MSVFPPDRVSRRSTLPVNLDDHALAVLIANMAAPDNDLVADFSTHPDHLLHRLAALVLPRIGASFAPARDEGPGARRLWCDRDAVVPTADELRVEYASLLGWTGGLVTEMLSQIEAASAKVVRSSHRTRLVTSQ
jgi:hypothetical protein